MFNKLGTIGDWRVGKTSILSRYYENKFIGDGKDFYKKELICENQAQKFIHFDIHSNERYDSVTYNYFKQAIGMVLIYDITNRNSFERVQHWVKQIFLNGNRPVTVLIGNKLDLQKARQVSKSEGQQLADSLGMQFEEVSALDNINIVETIDALFQEIKDRFSPK